jgi:KDO2-lipid IV(A) lauroyltransferase
VIVMLWERKDGLYEGYSKRLLVETAAEDREGHVEAIMTQINKEIEAAVREHPEQWLWMHDRWKTARERGLLNA